jgi:Na+/H+-dicarboxylate symporter
MKIYHKILIGIAVGVLVGLFFGPQSLVMEKDTIHVVHPSKVTLRWQAQDSATRFRLPDRPTVDFTVLGEQRIDGKRWHRVRFAIKSAHISAGAIPSVDEKAPRAGQKREAYLLVHQLPPLTSGVGHTVLDWIAPIGEIFLRLILMLVVPLVFTTLTVGVASLGNIRSLERLGLTALIYFLANTALAIAIGMGLSMAFAPGDGVGKNEAALLAEQFDFLIGDAVARVEQAPDLVSFLVQIVPDNPIHSMASARPNILQVMFFSIMFGVALTLIPQKRSRQVLALLDKTARVLVMVMHIVMAVAPLGVACLIAQTVGSTGYQVFGPLAGYAGVVVGGLVLHAMVISLVVRQTKLVAVGGFWRAIWPAQLIAFGTASSTATLPVTMTVSEEALGVSQRLSSFTITLGSSVNMPGTALFLGAALVFIAQAFGVELPPSSLATAFVSILFLSAGTAAVPSAGLVSLALALSVVGLPPVGIGLVAGFDRMLDMVRTPVNVASDLSGALLISRVAGETPQPLTPEQDLADVEKGFEHRLDVPQQAYDRVKDEDAD